MAQRNNVGWFKMAEVDFHHGVGATCQQASSRVLINYLQCLREGSWRENGHATSQPSNASIIAFTSPSGYKMGEVHPLSM